jgi:hypothetical protein
MTALYIADGHHRSAAASRICAARKAANPGHTGEEPYNYFLSVIFPDHQMKILDYNRVIRDLNGLSESEFLHRVSKASRRACKRSGLPGPAGRIRHVYEGTLAPPLVHQARPDPRPTRWRASTSACCKTT